MKKFIATLMLFVSFLPSAISSCFAQDITTDLAQNGKCVPVDLLQHGRFGKCPAVDLLQKWKSDKCPAVDLLQNDKSGKCVVADLLKDGKVDKEIFVYLSDGRPIYKDTPAKEVLEDLLPSWISWAYNKEGTAENNFGACHVATGEWVKCYLKAFNAAKAYNDALIVSSNLVIADILSGQPLSLHLGLALMFEVFSPILSREAVLLEITLGYVLTIAIILLALI